MTCCSLSCEKFVQVKPRKVEGGDTLTKDAKRSTVCISKWGMPCSSSTERKSPVCSRCANKLVICKGDKNNNLANSCSLVLLRSIGWVRSCRISSIKSSTWISSSNSAASSSTNCSTKERSCPICPFAKVLHPSDSTAVRLKTKTDRIRSEHLK